MPTLTTTQNPAVYSDRSLPPAFVERLPQRRLLSFLVVFLAVLAALKLNQYLFFRFDTSPAVVLMPTGIGLAAVYLGGYRMWVPLACAWFLALLSSPAQPSLVVVITAALAYPLQAVTGGYVLHRLNFLGTLGRTRCALIVIGTALFVSMVAPSLTTGVQWLTSALSESSWTSWSRAWAGSVMSILVFTPLITTWYRKHGRSMREARLENAIALTALVVVIYLTFWTKLPQINTFVVLYALFAVLFWIGLRLHSRIVATALFLTAFLGMAGSIIAAPAAVPLNQQLLADELFIILIAPIVYILAALVEERRASTREAELRARELEEANRKLSREDQAKNEFLATLAHELRNPLAPVVSSLELLKMEVKELQRPDLAQLVEVADTHNATLSHLLDDLLDISRISRKEFKLKKENFELRSVVERAKRTVDALYKSRGHTFSAAMPEEEVRVEADPVRLEQIIVNLLNNASKYTDPGGHIELTVHTDGEKGLRVSVKDNGIGIELGMLKKIFEPFIQSDDKSSGIGIGLSLTKRLAELHGGTVWAESEGLGKGSTFVATLPDARRAPSTGASRRQGGSRPDRQRRFSRSRRVLIVDDNEAAADGLKKLLEHGGHTVSVAYDGLSAIERMQSNGAEVVLLDIGLPEMSGYEVAKRLRQDHGDNPLILIALTGYGQEEDRTKSKEAGFNYHLVKPVGIADIEAVLSKDAPAA